MLQENTILPLHLYAAIRGNDVNERLFKSVQKYVFHPCHEQHEWPHNALWSEGSSELYFYPSKHATASNSLFVVPSLINGAEIFDLSDEYSFIGFLNSQGVDVYLLNWGNLNEHSNLSLSELKKNILSTAYSVALNHSRNHLHVLGHCLGGTILYSSIADGDLEQVPISLTLLAAPLDFHVKETPWYAYLSHLEALKKIISANGKLSQNMLQMFFGRIHPDAVIKKYLNFLDLEDQTLQAKIFVKVEDWTNSGSDLPGNLALDIFERFFIQNKVGSIPECLVHIITSHKDSVVPFSSATMQQTILEKSNVSVSNVECGHIGMMASSDAQQKVWEPLLKDILNK